jgi:tetratricopeptide (TPR) repeat protein
MVKKPILIVDDEKNIRLTMFNALEPLKIPVRTAVNGEEALEEENAVDYPSLIQLAKRHITDRSFANARETVRKAISTDPAHPEAYNLLGALLEIKGDGLDAQKFYRAALDIDPTFKPAQMNLDRTTSWNNLAKLISDRIMEI